MGDKYFDDVDFIPSCWLHSLIWSSNTHKYFLEHNIWGMFLVFIFLASSPHTRTSIHRRRRHHMIVCRNILNDECVTRSTRITYAFSIIYYLMHSHVHLDRTNNVVAPPMLLMCCMHKHLEICLCPKYLQSIYATISLCVKASLKSCVPLRVFVGFNQNKKSVKRHCKDFCPFLIICT